MLSHVLNAIYDTLSAASSHLTPLPSVKENDESTQNTSEVGIDNSNAMSKSTHHSTQALQ